ncbi:MAG: helix-hairpin-helix domain-containing protein [Salinisphaera sp.]|jgi:competence protein ComEA|nr:helix-hairpin-helix domain-containing protein [Salinisphaera sp.]
MKKILLILWVSALFYAGAAFAAVNINTADASSLSSLAGIGSVKADAIVAYRDDHGDFKSLDELTNVNGIGSKTVSNLRDEATVGSSD